MNKYVGELDIKEIYHKGKRIGQRLTQRNGKRFFRFVSSEGKYSEWEEETK